MNKTINHLLFFSLVFFFPRMVFSTHIVGGELNYRNLGGNNYEITLTVYRDCWNGIAEFDDPASIGIFGAGNNFIQELQVYIHDQSNIPNAVNTPCFTPPTDVCYEYARYVTTVNLLPRAGGYQIAYQRCCRNGTIINIVDPNAAGATYYATIPDGNVVQINSNPVFTNLPPTFVCLNAPFEFDHSATDPDGDSLVYELFVPLDGASQGQPMPQPPDPPPYYPVIYQSPYSLSNVMGGIPLSVNPFTGKLTAVPNSLGQFVYGVRVKEYRNGILIGSTQREFQANVTQCTNLTVASVFDKVLICGSLTAHFNNYSFGSTQYSWNFGDLATLADTSNLVTPDYTYPDTGVYNIRLIAYSGLLPLCNDTAYARAYVYPAFYAGYTTTNQHCDNVFTFLDTSIGADGSANYWHWDFGDGSATSVTNPAHIYAQPGDFNVTLISSTDSGCTDTVTHTMHVLPIPFSIFSTSIDTCAASVSLANQSINGTYYNWDFGDGTNGYTENASHRYNVDGTFTIQLITTSDSGCSDTSQFTITLPTVPIANFNFNIANCDSVVHFNNTSVNGVTYQWTFGDLSYSYLSSTVHQYTMSGTYSVTLTAFAPGTPCTNYITQNVTVVRKPESNFSTALDTCNLLVTETNQSLNATNYLWSYSDGGISTDINPQYHFLTDGNYNITLIARNDSGCADTINLPLAIPPLPLADFNPFRADCDSMVQFSNLSANSVSYRWNFGDADTSVDQNPLHTYHLTGDVSIDMISTSQYGCVDTVQKNISIITRVPADFDVFMDSCTSVTYFQSNSPLAVYYHWDFGDGSTSSSQNVIHEFQSTHDFPVILTVNKETGCDVSLEKIVKYETLLGEIIYVPNAFTPNEDGLNEKFQVISFRPCDVYSLNIFDRWGNEVFHTDDALNNSWNGYYKGHPVEEGIYVYLLKGTTLNKTGFVAVIK